MWLLLILLTPYTSSHQAPVTQSLPFMQLKYMIGNGGRFSCIGGEIFNLNRPWWRTHYYIMCIPGISQQLLFNYKYPASAELPSQAKCASTLRGRPCMASAANLVMMGGVGATATPIISERISERQESGKHWLLPSLIKRRDVIVVCSLVSADISNEFSRVLQSVPRSENPWIPISNPYLNLRYAFLH